MAQAAEQQRLKEASEKSILWKKWGPYLSERQWGTVREDYSADGNAWDYFTHDQARSRAYRALSALISACVSSQRSKSTRSSADSSPSSARWMSFVVNWRPLIYRLP